jgi:hypothetical protein
MIETEEIIEAIIPLAVRWKKATDRSLGITLAEWFLANGIRLVRNDWSHGEQHLQKRILAVLSSKEEGLTAREVKQKVRAAGSVERLAEILNGLVESGRAACVAPPSSANSGRRDIHSSRRRRCFMRNSLASVWIARRRKTIWRFVAEQCDRYPATATRPRHTAPRLITVRGGLR